MDKFISVIVPTYNDWFRLQKCLTSLGRQNLKKERFEVIVVNNNPANKAPNSLHLPANAKIIDEQKPGSYAARNAGLKKSKGEILAFTDSDCVPDNSWLQEALIFFRNHQKIKRMAGKVALTFRDETDLRWSELYEREYAFRQQENARKGLSVTANMICRRTVFDHIGIFNESLLSGGDFEWSKRATQAGFSLKYTDDVIVFHPARASLSAIWEKARRVYRGTYELEKYYDEGFLFDLLYGIYLLRPRLEMIRELSEKYSVTTLTKIMFVKYIYSLAQMITHYQLVWYNDR